MPTMYKLVSQDWKTHNGMQWKIGQTNRATGKGSKMCTNQVLHCYKSPEQAMLFNPVHAAINKPILLEIECSEIVANDALKYACKEQTPIKVVPLPTWTTNQKVAFAIRCALLVYKATDFVNWANSWLTGADRSYAAAAATARAAYAAAATARAAYAAAATARAAYAAAATARAAYAAAATARAAYAAAATARAAYAAATYTAADAATAAATAAADAATAADAVGVKLQEVIEWVINCFIE